MSAVTRLETAVAIEARKGEVGAVALSRLLVQAEVDWTVRKKL
jgi:uncharacterized protein with PIN domain